MSGLGQANPVAHLTSSMDVLQDSITGPQNGVKTNLDALSSAWNSVALPPPANSLADVLAKLAASSDAAIGPAVAPALKTLGSAIATIDNQAVVTANNFANTAVAVGALSSDYQALQQANQQYIQALQTLYAAAGYTDYNTPIGTVASNIGATKQQNLQLQQQVQQLQQPAQPAKTTQLYPFLNTTTILAGIAALAAIGGGIWWYTSQQKKKQPASQRMTTPAPAPMFGEQQVQAAARPARRSYPMSSRPNATARALMPRANQVRGLPPGRTGQRA